MLTVMPNQNYFNGDTNYNIMSRIKLW